MSMLNPTYMGGGNPNSYAGFRGGQFLQSSLTPLDSYTASNPNVLPPVQGGVESAAIYTNMVPQVGGNSSIDFTQDFNFGNKSNSGNYPKRGRNDGGRNNFRNKKQRVIEPFKSDERPTVFIGSLAPTCEEADLWDLFDEKQIPLTAVRKKGGKMFGHVDLENPADLERVLDLNGFELLGSRMRLEKSQATISGNVLTTAGKDTKTLFVANLASSVTDKMLRDFFPECEEVRLPLDRLGNHTGYAFLKYGDEEKVKSLITQFQGAQLEGNAMILDYAAGKNSRHKGPVDEEKDLRNLFIGNLNDEVTREDIQKLFPKAIEIRSPADNCSYCFIKFQTEEEAKKVMETRPRPVLLGQELIIDYGMKSKAKLERDTIGGSGGTKTIVVKNLSFDTDEHRLKQEFPECRHVRMVYFAGTNRSKGYSFIEFGLNEEADEAYYEINQVGRIIHTRVLVAEYALEKGSKAYKDRGAQMEEEKMIEYQRKSLWGPQGMAYEGFYDGPPPPESQNQFDMPNNMGNRFDMQGNMGNRFDMPGNMGNQFDMRGNMGNQFGMQGNMGNQFNMRGNMGNQFDMRGNMMQNMGGGMGNQFDYSNMGGGMMGSNMHGRKSGNQSNSSGQDAKMVGAWQTTDTTEEYVDENWQNKDNEVAQHGLPLSFTGRTGNDNQDYQSKQKGRQSDGNKTQHQTPKSKNNAPGDLSEEARNSGWGYSAKTKMAPHAVGYADILSSKNTANNDKKGGGKKKKRTVEKMEEDQDDVGMELPFSFTGRTGRK